MKKGNVLVIGNSGVGKSTLINAVLGDDYAETGWGTEGTTKELKIYENEEIPFRIIDSVGFEPSFISRQRAIYAVKKWSAESAIEDKKEQQINVIWFCVDGTSRKLFDSTIKNLSSATSLWPSVPIIVTITKSYSVPERAENIQMVNNAFAKQKKSKNLKAVIPVVASTYVLNDTAYAVPDGITELIDKTNEFLPEGIKAAKIDISAYKLNRRRAMAQSVVGVSTTAGVVVGAVPIPIADALILVPVETAEINAIALIYGITKDDESENFFHSILEAGTVSAAAKALISAMKAIPGINIGATALNAVMAGSIAAAIGEGSIYAFEQVYLGNKSVSDVDWVKKVIESKICAQAVDKVIKVVEKLGSRTDNKSIADAISGVFISERL